MLSPFTLSIHLFLKKAKTAFLNVPLAASCCLEGNGSVTVTGHLQLVRDFPFRQEKLVTTVLQADSSTLFSSLRSPWAAEVQTQSSGPTDFKTFDNIIPQVSVDDKQLMTVGVGGSYNKATFLKQIFCCQISRNY